ncbi:hypothetical protein J5X84_08905 [Streptosporangiaceae bacterium NEAU-GS5]|nr:hypothetical protein [Streptosporangiaceae bacterium NEAU-GS5]
MKPPPEKAQVPLALTKRGNRPEDRERQDATRQKANAERDRKFVQDLYKDLFVDGRLTMSPGDVSSYVYNKLAFSDPGYLAVPITDDDVANLIIASSGKNFEVLSQLEEMDKIDLRDALEQGDYIALDNKAYPGIHSTQERRERRLIVNVTTQQAALRITHALAPLFDSPDVYQFFKQVKVFVSTQPDSSYHVKNDKLVVYYDLGPERADGTDFVGDRLVDTINGAIGTDDVDETATPFYSELAPAIAWAEDPKDFIPRFSGVSFTKSRAEAIALAVRHAARKAEQSGQTMDNPDDLLGLIQLAFVFYGINPVRPNRHLPSSAF